MLNLPRALTQYPYKLQQLQQRHPRAPFIHINNRLQISIKLAEPKPFNGNTTQAHAWLSALKQYFITVGLIYKATEAPGILAAYQYAVVLMAGNTVR